MKETDKLIKYTTRRNKENDKNNGDEFIRTKKHESMTVMYVYRSMVTNVPWK